VQNWGYFGIGETSKEMNVGFTCAESNKIIFLVVKEMGWEMGTSEAQAVQMG